MTWSIVARDAASGGFGVAVASNVLAVGGLCPWLAVGVGALSTQSFTNPLYGPDVLARLGDGASIGQAIGEAVARDAGQSIRQVHGVDRDGRAYAHTGIDCIGWAGHALGDGSSIAGNMLAGPDVVDATLATWPDGWRQPFARRLLDALAAGEAAGGDKRGKRSAGIRVVRREAWPWIDLRADDGPEPIRRLSELLDDFLTDRAGYYAALPSRADPAGVVDATDRERIWRGYMRATGREDV